MDYVRTFNIIFLTVLLFQVTFTNIEKLEHRITVLKSSDSSALLQFDRNAAKYGLKSCECAKMCNSDNYQRIDCTSNYINASHIEIGNLTSWSKCKINFNRTSEFVEVKTTSKTPLNESELPTNITFHKNNHSLEVQVPECEYFNGEVKYELIIQCKSRWCKSENPIVRKPNKSYDLKFLNNITILPSTEYDITVIGKRSNSSVETQFPKRKLYTFVKQLKADCVTNNTIFIKWNSESLSPRDFSIGNFLHLNNIPKLDAKIVRCTFDRKFICANISVHKSNDYTIAVLKNPSRDLLGLTYVSAKEPEISRFVILWNQNQIILEWIIPNLHHCEHKKFLLKNDENFEDQVKLQNDSFQTAINIENNTQPIHYKFHIESIEPVKRDFGNVEIFIYHADALFGNLDDPIIEYCYRKCKISIPEKYNITELVFRNSNMGNVNRTHVSLKNNYTSNYTHFRFENGLFKLPLLMNDKFVIERCKNSTKSFLNIELTNTTIRNMPPQKFIKNNRINLRWSVPLGEKCSPKSFIIEEKYGKIFKNYTLTKTGTEYQEIFEYELPSNTSMINEFSYEIYVTKSDGRKLFGAIKSSVSRKIPEPNPILESKFPKYVILVLLLLIFIMFAATGLFIWRKKSVSKKQMEIPINRASYFYRQRSTLKLTGVRRTKLKMTDPPNTKQETKVLLTPTATNRGSRPVQLADIEEYILASLEDHSGENDFTRQFFNTQMSVDKSCEEARLARNQRKNRYKDLIPYDVNRVKLKDRPYSEDYINASYVNGYEQSKAFIAAQAPTLNTIADFWLMVVQEKITTIVMLTELVQENREKCAPYWPETNEYSFGNVSISKKSSKHFADHVARTFTIVCAEGTWDILHLQYLSWPDHGIPLGPQSFTPILKKVLAMPQQGPPILVHCTAGCGRTGTFILCDIALRMVAKEQKVDFLKILTELRQQRTSLVHNLDQYILAHSVVLECLTSVDFSIPTDEHFETAVFTALRKTTVKPVMQQVDKVTEQFLRRVNHKHAIWSSEDQVRNRFPEIIPLKQSHVVLAKTRPKSNTYINAITVDYYRCPKKFIVTQQPLKQTIDDFWHMVHQYEINTIISLNEISPDDPDCPVFWEYLHLELIDAENCNIYNRFQMKFATGENSRTINVIQMKNWDRSRTVPIEPRDLIEVWRKMFRVSWKGDSKIVVTCHDGTSASGLFVALAFIFEQIKLENVCDVFTAVRTIRQSRPEFVQDWAQFEFLYKAALEYYSEFHDYDNFPTKPANC